MKFINEKTASWLLAALLTTLSTAALAQQAPRPLGKPAPRLVQTPAAGSSAQATPGQPEVPQQTTATYADWIVQCQTQAGPPVVKICDMAQVTQVQGKNLPFSRIAIVHPAKGQPVKMVMQVPVNASFATEVHVQTGEDDVNLATPFARCIPAGCFAELDLREDVLRKFRVASGTGKMTFADAGGHDVAVPLSFNGFAQAYDALAKE